MYELNRNKRRRLFNFNLKLSKSYPKYKHREPAFKGGKKNDFVIEHNKILRRDDAQNFKRSGIAMELFKATEVVLRSSVWCGTVTGCGA